MDDVKVAEMIQNLLSEVMYLDHEDEDGMGFDLPEGCDKIKEVRSFEDAMLMTPDMGVVLRFEDGTEFQVTVKRSR